MKVRNRHAYDEDFAAWSDEQARLLRAGDFDALDIANVAEEIESLGRSNRHELKSRLTVLLAHLLKWRHQPERRTPSWQLTMLEQRQQIRDLLDESPSLCPFVDAALSKAHVDARKAAAIETGLPLEAFPADCPFALAQILDDEFYPDA